MKFNSTTRHDNKNFLYAMDDFRRNTFELFPKNICLDSAHDNIPTYELPERWDNNALIAINGRSKTSENTPHDLTFNKSVPPLCRAGLEMCPWRIVLVKDAHKYCCPLRCGSIPSRPYEIQCSPSSYGRTAYIKKHADLRFNPRISKGMKRYIAIYSERTAYSI